MREQSLDWNQYSPELFYTKLTVSVLAVILIATRDLGFSLSAKRTVTPISTRLQTGRSASDPETACHRP